MAVLSGEGLLFLLRWIHLLAGVTWVGMLYYFNFVQTPFFAVADSAVRSGMIVGGLLDRALWWFRWAAMLTLVSGWLILLHRIGTLGLGGFLDTSYGWAILYGALLGTVMWANVWLVIWPAQRLVIASVTQVARGGSAIPDAAARGMRAGIVSRTNTMLSVPMLFFMAAASHLTLFTQATPGARTGACVLLAVVLVLVELNALVGTTGPGHALLRSLPATLWAGVVLTVILYGGLELLFP